MNLYYPVGTFSEHDRRYQVRVELRISPAHLREHGRTIDHGPIDPDAVEVAISGEVWPATQSGARDRRYRDAWSAGQVVDDLRKVKNSRAQRLADLWERWHLNGMRPNCAHMPDQHYVQGMVCPAFLPLDPTASGPRPPSYRSGTAWLYEPIPADVVAELRNLCGQRS